jgi:hypothetical protein
MPLSGIRGVNGQILAVAGAVIILAGLHQLVRGGPVSRWVAGLAGFAALGFSGYLLIQLARSMRTYGSDAMVAARGGPGLTCQFGFSQGGIGVRAGTGTLAAAGSGSPARAQR